MAEVTQADREAANTIAEIIREEDRAVWHGAIERVVARHRTEAVKPLVEALELFRSFGCPVCNGDCASANPPVAVCPIVQANAALRSLQS